MKNVPREYHNEEACQISWRCASWKLEMELLAQETNHLKKADCALLDRAKICYIFGIFITRCNFFWRGDKISPPRFRENHYFFRGEGSNFQKSSLVSIIIVSDPINRMAFSDFKNSKYLLSYGQLKLHLFTIIILIFP